MSAHTSGQEQQLREAEQELAFCKRMHQQYRITERLTVATMRVQDLRAAIAAESERVTPRVEAV